MRWIIALALLCVTPALAQTPTKAPPTIPERGLMLLMARGMTGQKVIAVGFGNWTRTYPDEAVTRADTFLKKLEALCAAASDDSGARQAGPANPLIPFAVRGAWVVAPQTRQELNPDLESLSPEDITDRKALLERFIAGITPEQARQLGAKEGLRVSDLPAAARRLVTAALRPSMDIVEFHPQTDTDTHGVVHHFTGDDTVDRITDPIDPAQLRIRARLSTNLVDLGLGGVLTPLVEPSGTRTVLYLGDRYEMNLGPLKTDPFIEVPNTFKPSDLNARALTQHVGISGVISLKDVLTQVQKVTGLELHAALYYEEEPVFLGSPDLACGDVLDGVRLALTAAWRRLGNAYVLGWDRRGVRGVQQMVSDETYALDSQARALASNARDGAGWIAAADNIPLEDGSVFVPIEEQRASIYLPKDPRYGKLPFAELTPDQQMAIQRAVLGRSVDEYDRGQMVKHTVTDAELRGGSLFNQYGVEMSVNVPGHGWLPIEGMQPISLSNYNVGAARAKADGHPVSDLHPHITDGLRAAKPAPLPGDEHGLAVPVVSPSRLREIAKLMKAHGFQTLFYPVLEGGYATFPTTAFLLDPALRGRNGWAEAAAVAKAEGLRVCGIIDMLSWQRSSDKSHWLRKHPQWLDVDVLGRTRLAFQDAYPSAEPEPDAANFVRGSEPLVEARLGALLTDFARQSEAAGVALCDWDGLPAAARRDETVPPFPLLGYAVPDRISAVMKSGYDPVDEPTPYNMVDPVLPRGIPAVMGEEQPGQKHIVTPGEKLAGRLLDRARALRKDWTVYVVDVGKTSLTVNAMPRRDAGAPPGTDDWSTLYSAGPTLGGQPNPFFGYPPILLHLAFAEAAPSPRAGHIVLDFRMNPDGVEENLAWITPK